MENIKKTMEQLIFKLNQAARAYYSTGQEIMTNFEYDKMYEELLKLEQDTGIVLGGSPTQKVGYEPVSALPKENHQKPMLSLDKTKDVQQLVQWLGNKKGLLSWKLDGLTVVLTYEGGKLIKAVTRGNGQIGEVITENAKTFVNLPGQITFNGRLVLRGEALIRYSDFQQVNLQLPEDQEPYKNPRNLCAGSVRQLNPAITLQRQVRFYAFSLVEAEGIDFENSHLNELNWLASQGFDPVETKEVTAETMEDVIEEFKHKIEKCDLPSDGLVLAFDDISYGKSLGATAKFPRDAIAFKWQDQQEETVLREIHWSPSRTGLINPVAVFDPVELEGTTVTRASVHNISILRSLKLGIGDVIKVYKANMIIPQISENLTKSDNVEIPEECPVCQGKTRLEEDGESVTLHCTNPHCLAKEIKKLSLFVSRNAMNIDGLSEMSLWKLVEEGCIKEYSDIFKLENHRESIVNMEGFGEKSLNNLVSATEKASHVTASRLLYALGVSGIGVAVSKQISSHCQGSWEKIKSMTEEELMEIDGVGTVLAEGFVTYFKDQENLRQLANLEQVLHIEEENLVSFGEGGNSQVAGKVFVVTGKVNIYSSRDQLAKAIEDAGGKVASSVSKNTSYLINNDVNSTSGKNKKAKELGIPIIDEDTIDSWLKEEKE